MFSNIITVFIRFLLLMLSLGGYSHLLYRRFNIRQEFCPIISLCSIGCLLIVFGCFDVMTLGLWVIYLLGFILYIYDYIVISERNVKAFIKGIRSGFTVGIIFFVAAASYLFIWLIPAHIYYYDNFTHWELIVKFLIYNSRLPDASDAIIEYTSYPVGSSLFVWYVSKLVGTSEGIQLFAQSLISLASGTALLAYTDNKDHKLRAVSTVIGILFALGITTCYKGLENGIYSLMVDRLLAALGIAAVAIISYYRKELNKASLAVSPILIFVANVKNSGIFFVLTSVAFLLCLSVRRGERIKGIKACTYTVIPVIAYKLLWFIHVKLSFGNTTSSPHTVSISYYESILGEKTPDNIRQIINLFCDEVFHHNSMFLWLSLVTLMLIAVVKLSWGKIPSDTDLFFMPVFAFECYVIYQAGNLAMFIFSMPWVEAQRLSWYARYVMTIDAFCSGVLVIMCLGIIKLLPGVSVRSPLYKLITVVLSFFILPLQLLGINTLVMRQSTDEEGKLVDVIRQIDTEYSLPQDANTKYLVCFSKNEEWLDIFEPTDPNRAYRYYFCRTILYSSDITVTSLNRLSDLEGDDITRYDFFIFISPSESTANWHAYDELTLSDSTQVIEYSY